MTIYETLGVCPAVSDAELRQAYHTEARRLHPDRNTDPAARAELARLNTAWQSVNQPARRAAYDLRIEAERRTAAQGADARATAAKRDREAEERTARDREVQERQAIEAALAARRYRAGGVGPPGHPPQRPPPRRGFAPPPRAPAPAPAPEPEVEPAAPPTPRVDKQTVRRAAEVALDVLEAFWKGRK